MLTLSKSNSKFRVKRICVNNICNTETLEDEICSRIPKVLLRLIFEYTQYLNFTTCVDKYSMLKNGSHAYYFKNGCCSLVDIDNNVYVTTDVFRIQQLSLSDKTFTLEIK